MATPSAQGPAPVKPSPQRSTTLPHKPTLRHHPHLPHRVIPHQRNDKDVPQSAVERHGVHPFSDFFGHRSRGDSNRTVNATNATRDLRTGDRGASDAGKRQSQHLQQDPNGSVVGSSDQRDKEGQISPRSKEKDVRQRRQEAQSLQRQRLASEESLKASLAQYSALATSSTRRLDNVIYGLRSDSVLLKKRLDALHDLTRSMLGLNDAFRISASELEQETLGQLVTSEKSIDDQAKRVEHLQTRMQQGKEKVSMLNARLAAVQAKVEAAERRDGESRRRLSRRLNIMWSLGGSWMAILLIGILLRHSGVRYLLGMHGALLESATTSGPFARTKSAVWRNDSTIEPEISPTPTLAELEDQRVADMIASALAGAEAMAISQSSDIFPPTPRKRKDDSRRRDSALRLLDAL